MLVPLIQNLHGTNGLRSLLAPWIGGASAPPVSAGARSMLAFWMGGAVVGTTPITPPTVDTAAIGNIDWLKTRRRKPIRIKRSEYSTIEEYRDAVAKAAAALAEDAIPMVAVSATTGEVIGDDILEDDEILLMALTRILH